jgi:hypothetical protein
MEAPERAMSGARRARPLAVCFALVAAAALGGCQSPMYSGTPDDNFSYSVAPSYGAPYQVGSQQAEEHEPATQAWTAEQKYEYRGGRDPATGLAKTQL